MRTTALLLLVLAGACFGRDLVVHTRWDRTFKLIHGYHSGN